MCFSFESSLGTFLISWGISLYLLSKKLNKKQNHNVIRLLIFSTIQVLDAILWYINMSKNNINYYVTSIFIPLILSLQILYNIFIINNGKHKILNIITIIVCIYLFVRFNGYTSSLCNNKLASPVWGSNELQLWELTLFIILIYYPNWKNIVLTLCIIIPLIHIFVGGAYGSLWCFISNIFAFYFLITYKLNK